MKIRTNNGNRRGIASVEFALILPVLFLLIMGTIEMGTMFYSWLTVQKAAQAGARFAASGIGEEEGSRIFQITQTTEEWLVTLNGGAKEISIASWAAASAAGDPVPGNAGGPCQLVEVAVQYGYQPYTPLVGALLPEVIHLHGSDRKLNEPWKPCGEP